MTDEAIVEKARQVGSTTLGAWSALHNTIQGIINDMRNSGISPGYIVVGGGTYTFLKQPKELVGLPVYPINTQLDDFTMKVMPEIEQYNEFWNMEQHGIAERARQ
jgi:hypothetical protein